MIEADFRIAVTVEFAAPAGAKPEQMQQTLAQNGISVALGLIQWVRQVDAKVVPVEIGPKLV